MCDSSSDFEVLFGHQSQAPQAWYAGQKKPTRVVRLLVSGTVETRVLALQKTKGAAAGSKAVSSVMRAARTDVDADALLDAFADHLAPVRPQAAASTSPSSGISSVSE